VEKSFRKSLFGYKPSEVIYEIEHIHTENNKVIDGLKAQIDEAKSELEELRKHQAELEQELGEYMKREHMIADVLMKAQTNARRIEEEAQEKARALLEKSEEELKQKLIELEDLRSKIQAFKQDFRDTLDKYKYSLDEIKEPETCCVKNNKQTFTPTLIVKEKEVDAK